MQNLQISRLLAVGLTLFMLTAHAQDDETWVINTSERLTSIIKNEGQFDDRLPQENQVQYGFESNHERIFFATNQVYLGVYHMESHVKTEEEKAQRTERKKQGFQNLDEWYAFEREGHRVDITSDLLVAEWIGSNPDVEIIASEEDPFTHAYSFMEGQEEVNKNNIPSYQKITYKNLYPNVDVEYTIHPESGIKYTIILHPGADLSQVQLSYSKTPELNVDGSIRTATSFGDVIDHAPYTYYQGSEKVVQSAYKLEGNVISFELENYDTTKTVVIDPWTDLPNDPGSNWNCAWECETDALGNSWAIFGVMPMQLRKYNAAGAIQWTYNTTYDTTAWLGTFVVDDAGTAYVTNGTFAEVRQVTTAGVVGWISSGTAMLSEEFWNIAFNCDQTELVIGGTGGALPPLPYLYNMSMATGAITGQMQMTGGALIPTQEIRAVTATENEKYYWLSHDSIGYVSQSLSICPTQTEGFHVDNGYGLGYKCENWRYNNIGIEAIAYYGGYVYINRGNRIDKREFATANTVATATIPGGAFTTSFGSSQVENSGIIIDATGRIFVGSRGSVQEFDINLNPIASYPVTGGYNVYDVDLTSSGQIIACGATGNSGSGSRTGTVESLGAPYGQGVYVMNCCNASICQVDPLCDTDAPVTLSVEMGGGTFSSSAPGFNAVTGTFDPSIAGVGTYTFYYTLACGTDSVTIDVINCTSLTICVEASGDLTVSGGTGPYTWDEWDSGSSSPITNSSECTACGYTWVFGTCLDGVVPVTSCTTPAGWVNFGSGTTVTPPAGADTIQVTDAFGGNTVSYDISTLPPCSSTCDPTITPAGPFCENDPAVNLSAVDPGGTWSGTGITDPVNGTFDPATAGAGTWTITYSLTCGSSDTEDIIVNASDDASFSYASTTYCLSDPDPTPTITGTGGGGFAISGGGSINASSGQINLAATGTGTFTITYTTTGPCPASETFDVTINSAFDATITPAGPFCENDPAVNLSAVDPGGTWSGTGITDPVNGTFDPATAGAGTWTITYDIVGSCGATDTEDIVVNAADDASFSYAATTYCPTDPNPLPTVTGTGGGGFTISGGGTIDAVTGEVDIVATGSGTFTITYTTTGPCPDTETFDITINSTFDATITPAGPFCENDPAVNLSAVDPGGTWSGTGITDPVNGTFDPATAGVGAWTITYTIGGSCGAVDTEDIVVNAADDASFSYASTTYCLTDPNPLPTVTGTGGGGFTISGGGTIDAVTGEVDIVATGSGTFTITYTTTGPCPDTETFDITINSAFDATITPAGPFCESDPAVNLSAVDPGGTWSGTGITDPVNGTFDPATAGVGTHTITYTIGGSCGAVDTEDIVVNADDDASFSYTSASYCLSDPDPTPTVIGTGGGGFTISGGGTINATSGQVDLAATGAGTFTVTYTTTGPCPASETFNITISNTFDATITPVGPYCDNDPAVTLSAVDPGGTWSGTGITDPVNGTFDPATAGVGTHTITYTIPGSCGDTQTINIVVTAGANAAITPAGPVCVSDPAFNMSAADPGGTWSGTGITDPVNGTFDPATAGVGTHTITYTIPGPCGDTQTFNIIVTGTSNATITPAGPFCEDGIIYPLSAASGGGTWTGPGVNSTTGQFDPATAGPGTHEIIYTIPGSCGDADTIYITVNPLPNADAGIDVTIGLGNEIILTASGGISYLWSPSTGLSCTTCPSPTASPTTTTTYTVQVTDGNGCVAYASVTVYVTGEGYIWVPNAFSPNGDGENDILYVHGAGLKELQFFVYDRWGEKVFETTNINIGWDGTYKEQELNTAVFVYYLKAIFIDDEEYVGKGNISLIR